VFPNSSSNGFRSASPAARPASNAARNFTRGALSTSGARKAISYQ
jgi:hypothetical protein